MKKKKPPIIQITVLVFAICGLLIASVRWKFYNLSSEDQQKELQDQAMAQMRSQSASQESTKKVDSSKEVNELQKRTKQAAASKPLTDNEDMGPKNIRPSVVMPEETVRKPLRNAATTSSQWYDNK